MDYKKKTNLKKKNQKMNLRIYHFLYLIYTTIVVLIYFKTF